MKVRKYMVGTAVLLGCSGAAFADALTAVNYGGATGDAQTQAWVKPFAAKSGIAADAIEYTGDQAKVKAMVDAKNVTWDVLEVESADVGRGCQDGLYERLDWSKIPNKDDLMPGSVTPCAAGEYVWSEVLAYNPTLTKSLEPHGWKDFWDVKKFPGKRGMKKEARYNLEYALMADGVPPQDVYKALGTASGITRAFAKLDELKPYIQWWDAGAQPPQFLAAGDVVMSTAYNGRIDAAQRAGNKNLAISWDQSIYDLDFFVIPKGSKNKDAAQKYIAYTLTPEAQVAFAQHIPYGPTNKVALKLLDANTLGNLPNAPKNAKNAIPDSVDFWTDHGDGLEQRFAAWAAK
ncbi:ABC transporter substrate-binding protein [Caballeronia sordidicola]|jgi:putative spermidine/putrescine transport system substrate-binding protein|uniref:ABC transporter, periplasmic spermidine putrescine-binding protein PotD n=1 Tax=Caballeronia sordidicola TaxID=196367 RepID=A0A226WKI3_CABSO|nr:ABC transporter substrate-binding protein [Caballeronia sordidicola]OXC71695.1 ABC transporter, periplasmic spermidine putrescine-binding protein PotD [Caballeronia sordidicola]